MMASVSNFAQGDLRFLLPLQPGQRVLILGDAPSLIASLRSDKLTVEQSLELVTTDAPKQGTARESTLPYDTATLDHAILLLPPRQQLGWWIHESARVIIPGGWLLLGVHNAHRLQRLRFWKRTLSARTAYTHVQVCHSFASAGLRMAAEYGVHDNLQRPEQLVPLEHAGISAYFFTRVIAPSSRLSSAARHIVPPLVALGLHRALYTDLVFVACRED